MTENIVFVIRGRQLNTGWLVSLVELVGRAGGGKKEQGEGFKDKGFVPLV